jgi:hypothetical protein
MYRAVPFPAFAAAQPHCWVVWEPGTWKPPAKGGQTLVARHVPTPPPPSGEALAMALSVRPGRPPQLTLGRAPSCDLEINDATLSQVHLLFMQASALAWTVRDANSKNGSWLGETELKVGAPYPLAAGDRIQAAQVCLTFYDPAGLFARLQAFPGYTPVPRMQGSPGA